jgi:hypothetical protein
MYGGFEGIISCHNEKVVEKQDNSPFLTLWFNMKTETCVHHIYKSLLGNQHLQGHETTNFSYINSQTIFCIIQRFQSTKSYISNVKS